MIEKPDQLKFETPGGKIAESSAEAERFAHWSMKFMSLVSLFALMLYSYVLLICRKSALTGGKDCKQECNSKRIKLSYFAFSLDFLISVYFSAITPTLLKKGGFTLGVNRMPRPLFLFFAITGFVPTASMSITIFGGKHWEEKIRTKRGWRLFHTSIATVAYFSWWIACSPIFLMSLAGEKRALELLHDWSKKMV